MTEAETTTIRVHLMNIYTQLDSLAAVQETLLNCLYEPMFVGQEGMNKLLRDYDMTPMMPGEPTLEARGKPPLTFEMVAVARSLVVASSLLGTLRSTTREIRKHLAIAAENLREGR